MLENSVTIETETDIESFVEKEENHNGATKENAMSCFLMPLPYPLFTKNDYKVMHAAMQA
ncbi:hypothetical protein REPUB_Repub17cG0182700 [Reevesia pubescens]